MPGGPFLAGDRLTLRAVEPEDYAFVAEHGTRPTIRHGTNAQDPITEPGVADLVEGDGVHVLPCRDGEPVGFAWAFDIDDQAGRAEVGYWIVEGERVQGYATDTLELLAEWAFVERGLHRLQATVLAGNDASARVLEKVGFEREGTRREHLWVDGEHVDAAIYGLLAPEWRA
jgi:RimJ/RimL family protein N-acetyltransferase